MVTAAVAILDFEREAIGATITSIGDALWWSLVTITTVGYGDITPVTVQGRMVAGAMMVVGIALLGVVTATVAAWFLKFTSQDSDEQQRVSREQLSAQIAGLEAKVEQLLKQRDVNG